MAARTNAAAVGAVIELNPALQPTEAINRANRITNVIAGKDVGGALAASGLLLDIETLLAAHYYSLRDPQYKQRTVGQSSATFNDRNWWDEAKKLDTTGTLANMDEGNKKVDLVWLGLPRSQQTAHRDRN